MSWAERSSADDLPAQKVSASAPRILCGGIIVLDKVFRVEEIPQPDSKVEAKDFFYRQWWLRGERSCRRRAAGRASRRG